MRIRYFVMLAAAGALLLAAEAPAQDIYYVQSVRAKVMSSPSFKSKIVTVVNKGYGLQALGREGRWIKVKYGNREGYVPAMLVSKRPPLDRQGLISGTEEKLDHNVRRRASTYTSAAAARGLAADDRRRLSAEGEIDYRALEKVEAFSVSDEELAKFQAGGAL